VKPCHTTTTAATIANLKYLPESAPTNRCFSHVYLLQVLWEIITRQIPFKGIEGVQVAWLVVERGERLTIPSSCPEHFSKLMSSCWYMEPKKRPDFKSIIEALDNMLNDASLEELTETFLSDKLQWGYVISVTFRPSIE